MHEKPWHQLWAWEKTGGGGVLEGVNQDPSLSDHQDPAPPDVQGREDPAGRSPRSYGGGRGRRLLETAGIVNSLKPARFENKHVKLPCHTFWESGQILSQAEASARFPPLPAPGGGASCICISTWNPGRGARMRTARPARPGLQPAAATPKHRAGCGVVRGAAWTPAAWASAEALRGRWALFLSTSTPSLRAAFPYF